MVKTLLLLQGAGVGPLVQELRSSHMPPTQPKKSVSILNKGRQGKHKNEKQRAQMGNEKGRSGSMHVNNYVKCKYGKHTNSRNSLAE